MNNHPESPDVRIDRVLNALRETVAPTGLETRIVARISNAKKASSIDTSGFAVILNAVKHPGILFGEARLYTSAATALTVLLAVFSIALLSHHKAHTIAQSDPLHVPATPQIPAQPMTLSNAQPTAQAISNVHHQPLSSRLPLSTALASPTTPPDPDTIALAETLAPSHPASPMPLTQQERLLLRATRQGAPIQLAELDLAREPALRAAAEVHDKATLQEFARSLLAPLVTLESLDTAPLDDSQSAPNEASSSSNPNERSLSQ